MHKLRASAYKEFILLIRDLGGLAILFIMPLVLLIVITLVQDSTFKTLQDTKIGILLVDNDKGKVSKTILEGLDESNSFEIIKSESESETKDLVFKGNYPMAIVIPEGLSVTLQKKVDENVTDILSKFGMEEDEIPNDKTTSEIKEVRIYFDPATQQSFKSAVKNNINQMIAKIESQTIYEAFQEELSGDDTNIGFDSEGLITFKEIMPTDLRNAIPNSTQHNVPAWSLFAIFFIILPLSINIVKEKNQGTFVRLRTNPVPFAIVLAGKTLVYICVCLLQFALMLLIGIFLFPAIGLPELDISNRLFLLFIVAFFAGLAAIGLGLLLGTVAQTQEQAAPFGATLVVILAALGGVWVPVFVMPGFMQVLSNISPMNWGLNAFYDVFLRQVGFQEILPEIGLLFLFFILTSVIAIAYNERKNAV